MARGCLKTQGKTKRIPSFSCHPGVLRAPGCSVWHQASLPDPVSHQVSVLSPFSLTAAAQPGKLPPCLPLPAAPGSALVRALCPPGLPQGSGGLLLHAGSCAVW